MTYIFTYAHTHSHTYTHTQRRSQCCLTKDAKVMEHVMIGAGGSLTIFAGKADTEATGGSGSPDGSPQWDQKRADKEFGSLDPVKSLISR